MRWGYSRYGYASYPESEAADPTAIDFDLWVEDPELAKTVLPRRTNITERQRIEGYLKRPFQTPLVDPGDGGGPRYERSDFSALLSVFSSFARDFTEIQLEVLASRYVDYAYGVSLDKIGELVRLKRNTDETDDHYRIRLKARFRQIVGGCTIDEVREMAALLLGIPVSEVSFSEPFGATVATVELEVSESVLEGSPVTPEEFVTIMRGFTAAGVELRIFTSGGFMHKSVDDPTDYEGRGYEEGGYAGRLDTQY